jgi:hypothetical protein
VGHERGPLSLVSTTEELLGRKSSGFGLERGREVSWDARAGGRNSHADVACAAGVVAKFREGLAMAGKFLGLNTAEGVAHLVSTSLLSAPPQRPKQGPDARPQHGLFSGFLSLLGLDSTKLGAIALNAVVFMAKLVSTLESCLRASTGQGLPRICHSNVAVKELKKFRGVSMRATAACRRS